MSDPSTQNGPRPGGSGRPEGEPILAIEGLKTYFHTDEGIARAVDGVTYSIQPGETLGVVGESGSGKSVTALSILQLLPMPPGKFEGGRILFRGENLLEVSEKRMREIRGNDIAMIFQEPMTALNPVFTVGNQIGETVMLHQGLSKEAARERSIDMLRRVGIPSPEARVDEYPHQLSGGMRQRVMIAMAMACGPALLIADEPTTALDVTIQAQILDLIKELQDEEGMSVLLITHDLGVVAETAHHVAVMYAGRVVEYASAEELFERPRHPYTIGLLRSLPDLATSGERLVTIPGIVPSATRFPSGCRFRTRCSLASEICAAEVPPLERVQGPDGQATEHTVACHHLEAAEAL
ncbi:Oligopeptide transport ATP-binding protein OppD [Planctomycetes bacterium Poly30]|uniref:Oligopeptide transport ATP-binding protein OppD n=1 Tax=Saltatorellus ferox TaxID=2528018 RepID=A0A518EW10_9BACT|nr:Oligopeptide transport ATP-binding protein OppD [Planctomycetes bacterium Poly30]